MDGPIKMYRKRQILNHNLPVAIPKCMYSMKNIHSRDTQGIVPNSADHVFTSSGNSTIFEQNNQQIPGMAALEAKQEEILKQLAELKKQIHSIKLNLKINPTSASKPQNVISEKLPDDLPDLVINASPTNPPFSLELIQKLLGDKVQLKFTCHIHSSLQSVPDKARQLEESLLSHQTKEGIPNINIKLIWKNVGVDTEFMVSRFPVLGEVNLLRYLIRAIPSQLSYTSDVDSVEIDYLLDTCYLISKTKTKTERTAHLTTLNKSFGKSQWLGGRNELSVADIAAYSSLKQVANSNELNGNLNKWYKRCETVA